MAQYPSSGLEGTLQKNQTDGLLRVVYQTVVAELEPASHFLAGTPDEAATLTFYAAERAKQPAQVTAAVDMTNVVDLPGLGSVSFTPAMWNLVKGCRQGAHFAKLDLIANYYASTWGNRRDGSFSIDAVLNEQGR